MEKEYREKIDETRQLLAEGKKDDASDLLDSMNWKKTRNINILTEAGKLFEEADRDEEALDLLETAHERSPIGRMILYELVLLCVKMGKNEEARAYYDEFVQISPDDYQKYILKYRLAEARGADDYTKIAILEDMKENEFLEEWAYELAVLYNKTGQIDKCVDICDEIALYFGDGPYVEKALELKMLYHPLNPDQEDQYRSLQDRREGVTEIRPTEELHSGEILTHTMKIPEITPPQEKFNTINLQAELRKNIDEIMSATEKGEIHENMENIRDLVEDIPYLQVQDEKNSQPEAPAENAPQETIMDHYRKYLEEQNDGQLSLSLPADDPVETQIDGQMTIDDVMKNWEKTKTAAEAALQEAKQAELEKTKQEALRKANRIMDRLSDITPRLDAGETPEEILKQEILSRSKEDTAPADDLPEADTEIAETTADTAASAGASEDTEEAADPAAADTNTDRPAGTFRIPRVGPAGDEEGTGLEIPVLRNGEQPPYAAAERTAEDGLVEARAWEPDRLTENEEGAPDDVNFEDASRIIAGVNNMLQREIDRLSGEDEAAGQETPSPAAETTPKVPVAEDTPENVQEHGEFTTDSTDDAEISRADASQTEPSGEAASGQNTEADEDTTPTTDDLPVNTEEAAESADNPAVNEETAEPAEDLASKIEQTTAAETAADADAPARIELTADERSLFSYFLPIDGMEANICAVLSGAAARLSRKGSPAASGNIVITGSRGSGKTTLAQGLIKVLQKETGLPGTNVGRIDGGRLNDKDVQSLYRKISGGCLVIEKAGDIRLETAVTLSLLMDNDTKGTLVILEDSAEGVKRALALNGQFAQKFTERIQIPVFSVDNLVKFGETYARENGYEIDELGILAMYDIVNRIQRLDRPTYLSEICEIVDGAISHAEKKGLFRHRHRDEKGRPVLVEKDFM